MTVKFQNQKLATTRTRPDEFKYPIGLNGGGPEINAIVNVIGTPAITVSPATNKVIPGANGNVVIMLNTSGSFTIEDGMGSPSGIPGSMLIVAGGGASQPNYGPGPNGGAPSAGAGGLNHVTGLSFIPGTQYTFQIGAGGSVAGNQSAASHSGHPSNTSINGTPYDMVGGGGGGNDRTSTQGYGAPGGSGGGAGSTGVPGQGFPGYPTNSGFNSNGTRMGGAGAGGTGGGFRGGMGKFFNISGEIVGYAGGGGGHGGPQHPPTTGGNQDASVDHDYNHYADYMPAPYIHPQHPMPLGNSPGNQLCGGGTNAPRNGGSGGAGTINRGGGAGSCFGGALAYGGTGGSGVAIIELDTVNYSGPRNQGPSFGL